MNYQIGNYLSKNGQLYKCFVRDEVFAVFAPVEIEDGAEVLNFKDVVVMSNSIKEDHPSPIERVINYKSNNRKTMNTETVGTGKQLVSFGKAIEALKQGKRVQREGWNGKGMFIFMRPSDELSVDMIINKVKSLPQSVKDYYISQHSHTSKEAEEKESPKDRFVKFTEYLCMKAADGSIVNGWLASQTDILAEDWIILD